MTEVEELTARLALLEGPDGLDAFEADISKLEASLKQQITLVQGQLQALGIVTRLLSAHRKTWAGEDKPPVTQPTGESGEEPPENPVAKERIARLNEGFCTFASKGPKWCERKLKTKFEQEQGYCSVHLNELGIVELPKTSKKTLKKKKTVKKNKQFRSRNAP